MRHLSPALALLILAACSPTDDASDFAYETTFNKRTNGVILHEDGDSGHAGMFGTNCPFDVESGAVTGDYDLPGSDEEIQDGEPTEVGEITFTAVQPDVVHVVDKTGGEYTVIPLETPGVSEARLAWDGIVYLDAACRVKQVDLAGTATVTYALDGCSDADIEVDPTDGSGIVATLGHTAHFANGELTPLEVQGDMVAYDGWSDLYYLAERGAPTLTAITPEGQVVWSVQAPYPITSLDDAGMLESAAVVLERPDGRGEIAFFDAAAGDLTRRGVTPSPADDLAVSDSGTTLALVRPEQSFFFRLID